jgi:hypothetical protein
VLAVDAGLRCVSFPLPLQPPATAAARTSTTHTLVFTYGQ